jgi:hypothetical protein
MLAHPVVAAVSDRRRRSEIDATIYVPPYSVPDEGSVHPSGSVASIATRLFVVHSVRTPSEATLWLFRLGRTRNCPVSAIFLGCLSFAICFSLPYTRLPAAGISHHASGRAGALRQPGPSVWRNHCALHTQK